MNYGMVDVFLNKKWVKCSPAFNKTLCKKCQVAPLDFNGETDSIFQEYNPSGEEFMEYLEDYGHFDEFPLTFIHENMKNNYPLIAHQFKGQEDIYIS